MWQTIAAVVTAWGPWGLLVLLLLTAVWAYATDRIVSAGRFAEKDAELARTTAELEWYRTKLFEAIGVAEEWAQEHGP